MRAILSAVLILAAAAAGAELPVAVSDRGYLTRCAEKDNVVVAMTAPGARRFEVSARHPAFEARLADVSSAPDFTDCVFPVEPIWDFDPQTHLLHEDATWRLMGHRLEKSWRPELVDVAVGGRVWPGIHLLQLFLKRPEGDVEFLVLYPSDGYWRPRPLPPLGRSYSPYGASFLIGPVEHERRPLVRLSRVTFDPATVSFGLDFARGGGGRVRVAALGAEELRLEVTLDRPAGPGPTALLSSMFVADDNADVGRMRLRRPGAPLWRSLPPQGFAPEPAAEIAFDKTVPSRHNTLAPDVFFGPFRAE